MQEFGISLLLTSRTEAVRICPGTGVQWVHIVGPQDLVRGPGTPGCRRWTSRFPRLSVSVHPHQLPLGQTTPVPGYRSQHQVGTAPGFLIKQFRQVLCVVISNPEVVTTKHLKRPVPLQCYNSSTQNSLLTLGTIIFNVMTTLQELQDLQPDSTVECKRTSSSLSYCD